MVRNREPLTQLRDDQLAASSPLDHAALSASAGTGKTHVLTARVLRLLLAGVDPSTILCLTFTKAGAAEMAERIHARLAYWVRLKDSELRKELFALGEPNDDDALAGARTRFAAVLDAPGGGLRIQTIHAFAQSLLAGFPAEASLTPGFRPLEGREEQELARSTLAESLVLAEESGDAGFIRDVQLLSHRLGEGAAEAFLLRCGRAIEAMQSLGPREGIEARLRRAFGIPAGNVDDAIAEECCDEVFDVLGLRRIATINRQWGGKTGSDRAEACERWLAGRPAERVEMLGDLHLVWARKDGELRSFGPGQAPQTGEDYAALAMAAFECCARLLALRRGAAYVASLAAALRAGQTFALAYAKAKRAAGVVDFDDLIRTARTLLMSPGMGDWVRYKLDQATDHILVDEAQDTNDRQWDIVRALAFEYFAGEGASERLRTIFTVGDFKQAIFGFQGTNPEHFNVAVAWFAQQAQAIDARFLDLSIERNFRSSPPILELVDRLLDDLGHEALGLPEPARPHQSHHENRPGLVTLWRPFAVETGEDAEEPAGEEGWISDSLRLYAGRIARQIREWLDHPFAVAGGSRLLRPEDILILVRRRSQLASLLVARLHEEGVAMAGVDRLLLSAPLAVQDLLAAARFAIQPLDDLNLASLLVSPLFGWSQEDLFAIAHGREGKLWPSLRSSGDPRAGEAVEQLGALLAMADFATPHFFYETILSGPLDGRRKLLRRLGSEARDPIEELLARALEFEQHSPASLQRFLDWFARGDVEIVRDPSAPIDAVRVMTVHGAKGLQAPVVILADACADPERSGNMGSALLELDDQEIPIVRPRKDELLEPLRGQLAAQAERERQEHWRLLYVALTRAEERLYIGGALGAADRNGPPAGSWYAAVERSLHGLGHDWNVDPLWSGALVHGSVKPVRVAARTKQIAPAADLPAWLRESAPPEARPPRPLTPSAIDDGILPEPPPTPSLRAAAERGRLLHQLFERMPAAAEEHRLALADAWLARSAGVGDPQVRSMLVQDASAIIADPQFADIFSANALAEAPIAAVTADGIVISGTVDRLLVTDGRVRLVDFKTGRSVPRSASEIAVPHLRQMAAYVAALGVIFPGSEIEAALLYTAGPVLYPLPEALLAPHMPGTRMEG